MSTDVKGSVLVVGGGIAGKPGARRERRQPGPSMAGGQRGAAGMPGKRPLAARACAVGRARPDRAGRPRRPGVGGQLQTRTLCLGRAKACPPHRGGGRLRRRCAGAVQRSKRSDLGGGRNGRGPLCARLSSPLPRRAGSNLLPGRRRKGPTLRGKRLRAVSVGRGPL